MFGYVNIYKPELKVKDYEKYRAYYCGLCQVLQREYGMLGKMTLSYDITFLIVFLTSVYEPESHQEKNRCMVHPLEKRWMMTNEITEYAAAMNIVLMYYKFVDDWQDDKNPVAMVGIRSLHKQFKKIEQKYPNKCSKIRKALQGLSKAEAAGEMNLDLVAGYFGQLMSELFAYREDIWEEDIRKMAFYLGKFIYIMDAYDDFEEDQEKDHYNPLIEIYEECSKAVHTPDEKDVRDIRDPFDRKCESILTLMMADCTNSYEKLPCVENEEILKNILYVGVWTKYDAKIRKKYEQEQVTDQ